MKRLGRITIGLYNTYDPIRFHEAHRRALARAAPIAYAFECNLATFGFPYPEDLEKPREIAEFIASSTTIGEGGRYLIELAELGRFNVFPFPERGFPPQLGDPVATTSYPERPVRAEKIAEDIIEGRSKLLVFGLGRRGLPKDVMEICREHLDITDRRISLETCTAIGAVIARIYAHVLERIEHVEKMSSLR